jgi:hypothetical protein
MISLFRWLTIPIKDKALSGFSRHIDICSLAGYNGGKSKLISIVYPLGGVGGSRRFKRLSEALWRLLLVWHILHYVSRLYAQISAYRRYLAAVDVSPVTEVGKRLTDKDSIFA